MKPLIDNYVCNYAIYSDPDNAELLYERQTEEKRILGIVVRRKRFRRDTNIIDRRKPKQTGFKK